MLRSKNRIEYKLPRTNLRLEKKMERTMYMKNKAYLI